MGLMNALGVTYDIYVRQPLQTVVSSGVNVAEGTKSVITGTGQAVLGGGLAAVGTVAGAANLPVVGGTEFGTNLEQFGVSLGASGVERAARGAAQATIGSTGVAVATNPHAYVVETGLNWGDLARTGEVGNTVNEDIQVYTAENIAPQQGPLADVTEALFSTDAVKSVLPRSSPMTEPYTIPDDRTTGLENLPFDKTVTEEAHVEQMSKRQEYRVATEAESRAMVEQALKAFKAYYASKGMRRPTDSDERAWPLWLQYLYRVEGYHNARIRSNTMDNWTILWPAN